MNVSIERVRKALWSYRQLLSQEPSTRESTVSDLFIWRKGEDWQTFFELTDICGLFADPDSVSPRQADILFFDQYGGLLDEQHVDIASNERRTIDLGALLPDSSGPLGTFCVFHPSPPREVSEMGSFVAERGYVSYRYARAPIRSYVHGNLDAAARTPDGRFELLGCRGVRRREYRMQHALSGPAVYELLLVNPTPSRVSVRCRVFSTSGGQLLEMQKATLVPSGCHAFRIEADRAEASRVVIDSHLIMARPVVFRVQERSADVFHG